MADRQELIERILERFEWPACRGRLPVPPALSALGRNPQCGDVVEMFVEVEAGALARVTFEGAGCTISQACADLAAEQAQGRSVAEAAALSAGVLVAVVGHEVVRSRLECATLGLRTLHRALGRDLGPAASEPGPEEGGEVATHHGSDAAR